MPSQKILAEKQEAVATLAAKMRTASAGVIARAVIPTRCSLRAP